MNFIISGNRFHPALEQTRYSSHFYSKRYDFLMLLRQDSLRKVFESSFLNLNVFLVLGKGKELELNECPWFQGKLNLEEKIVQSFNDVRR